MEPLKYDQIQYNEPVYWLQERWGRKLDEHEINIVKLIYRYTRTTQEAEEIRILEAVACGGEIDCYKKAGKQGKP